MTSKLTRAQEAALAIREAWYDWARSLEDVPDMDRGPLWSAAVDATKDECERLASDVEAAVRLEARA